MKLLRTHRRIRMILPMLGLSVAACGKENAIRLRPDTTPPAAVTDLTAWDSASGGAMLSWTAPGDDGDLGRATAYDLRFSARWRTPAEWDSADAYADPPGPGPAGQQERVRIRGLPDGTWYFAVRVADEAGNRSDWSNVASAALTDRVAPGRVRDLAACSAAQRSVVLRWSAPGDDNDEGKAAEYDLRYSLERLTEESWSEAYRAAAEPAPGAAGTEQTCTIDGLERDRTYFFALKTADDRHQWSALSNVVAESTAAFRRITSLGHAAHPCWSPDGRSIACQATVEGNTDIRRVSSVGGAAGRLTDAPGFDGFPAWSPDGNRIAFVSDRGGGARRLWLMGAEGTDPILLADHAPYSVSKCSWSPDGTSIAYQVSASAHSSERAEIWVHEIGALPRRMLGGDGFSYADPAWSPDGLRIAYATDRDGATEIWILATGW